jgi:hypothetical protein
LATAHADAEFNYLTMRGCTCYGASDFAVYINKGGNIRLLDCVFSRSGAGPQDTVVGRYGIRIGAVAAVPYTWVERCRVNAFTDVGIYVKSTFGAVLRDNNVDSTTRNVAAVVDGIYVDSVTLRAVVAGNFVDGVTSTGAAGRRARGISVDGDRVLVRDNVVNNLSAASGGSDPPIGVHLKATAQYCMVDGNQTNGAGITNDGADNSIGAMNRDDA